MDKLEQGCAGLQQPGHNGIVVTASAPSEAEQQERSFDHKEARRFLDTLGKDHAQTWVRAIDPLKKRKAGPDHQGLTTRADLQWLQDKTAAGFNLYAVISEAPAASGAGGGVTDADVTCCGVLFAEWDDGASIEEQAQRWQAFGLPEPTVMVATGGKSVHAHWLLTEPMQPDQWRVLQKRLITYVKGDQQCKNPSRVMRLPGSIYYEKETGAATGQCRILATTDARYSAAEIEACLPREQKRKPVPAAPKGEWEPRGIDEINAAAEYIPRRKGGEGTYEQDRNALCGCSAALAEAGVADPDGAALALLGHLWPSEREAQQVLESTATRNAASFWAIAGGNGYNLKRSSGKRSGQKVTTAGQPPEEEERQLLTYSQLMAAMLAASTDGDDDTAMALRADAISRFRRTDAQIEAALFRLHAERELGISHQKAPESLDLSRISGMNWLVEGFVPDNDQTLLWGDAGTGKTTAALGFAGAVLKGLGFLDHENPAPRGSVLFIASDSGSAPLYAAMQEAGMADLPEVQEGPGKRFHVWAADRDQGMTAWAADLRGCIRLLEFIKRHQIRLVIIDSCKTACSGAGLDYTSNQLVSALLTYVKEVICPHAALVWLNHDGVAKGAHAGAKAWKEVPSMVHRIIREENKDGSFVNSRRLWRVTKSRMGPTREFYYEIHDGEPKLSPHQERVGNCLARVVDVLAGALQLEGQASLTKADLVERVCMAGGPSKKTLENTLCSATRAKHPEVCRAGRGRYKLAPRIADSLKGHTLNGKELGQNPVTDSDLATSRQVPEGSSPRNASQANGSQRSPEGEGSPPPADEVPEKFPREFDGKLPNASAGLRSDQIPSRFACASYGDAELTNLLELVELPTPIGDDADLMDDGDLAFTWPAA